MSDQRVFCRHALLPGGWAQDVLLDVNASGQIIAVERHAMPAEAARLEGYVIPGMANVHSHGFQYLMAGRTGPSGAAEHHFWSWREQMYQLAGRIDPKQYEDCLAWVYLQMLRAGYTACAEFHYLHHQPDGRCYGNRAEMGLRVLSAARRVGMPLTLLPVLYRRSGFGADDVSVRQRRFRNDVDGFLKLVDDCRDAASGDPLVKVGVAPHSLRAVSLEELGVVLSSVPASMPVHIHVAEQPAEVAECRAHTGDRPVQCLLDRFPLDDRWCLVHATHMTDGERNAAAASGAVAGLCPTTEADLGDGFFPLEQWIATGGAFGIGSDSNTRIGVAEELRLLEYEARLRTGRRNVLAQAPVSVAETLYMATSTGGSRAIGQDTGQLATGLRADLVELDAAHPLLLGLSSAEVLDAWVFAGDSNMVRSVWVAGRRIIDQGHHAAEASIERSFRSTVTSLRR